MIPTRPVSSLAPGVPFARFVRGLRFGEAYAEGFKDSPHVGAAIAARSKAATAGLTADALPDLAQLGVYDLATAQMLGGTSAIEACASRMRRVPFDVPCPRELTTGSGGDWIVEGASMPSIAFAFDTIRLKPARLGSIVVLTDELLRHPHADAVILAAILGAQGRTETAAFLSPSSAATADHPGSITSTGTAIANTGHVAADLASMLAAIASTGSGLAWIASMPTFATIAAAIGSASDLPRSLLGLPTIVAANAPTALLTLADLASIAFASTPIDVERSTEATIEMLTNPTNAIAVGSPDAPVATQLVSLYQTDSTGFKVQRYANWIARSGAVAYLSIDPGSPA
jgi:HK97 family phage major capsid protein